MYYLIKRIIYQKHRIKELEKEVEKLENIISDLEGVKRNILSSIDSTEDDDADCHNW